MVGYRFASLDCCARLFCSKFYCYLNALFNKIIYHNLLIYNCYKVGHGLFGDCWGRYRLMQDKSNNILVFVNCPTLEINTTVNGVELAKYSNRQIKIPISKILNIKTKYYREMRHWAPLIDTLETNHLINATPFFH